MGLSDDVFPPDDRCEICGAELDDEIVIQEFADGSLARLCAECAAGTALEPDYYAMPGPELAASEDAILLDADALDITKELLSPVVDLITLQGEMQGALERLATSLERFAAGVLTENLDKTAVVEDRVQTLERELERTRARLREAELLLAAAPADAEAGATPLGATPAEAAAAQPEPAVASVIEGTPRGGVPVAETTAVAPAGETQAGAEAPTPVSSAVASAPPVPAAGPAAAEAGPAEATGHPALGGEPPHSFRLEEVQAVQRYFNESPFTAKITDVRQSLGRPKANVTRAAGTEPRAFVTVAWDIVWYQYQVDLRRDIRSDERVILYREGMDLDELADHLKEKNASIDDDGRLDASELEVRLLSDPSALITEMTPDEERALEDATEEVWDQKISPEFKWDA